VEGVGEEELGEFALAEGDKGGFRGGGRLVGGVGVVLLAVVGLHLHALAEVHEGFIDFTGFGECRACGFGCAGALGTWDGGLSISLWIRGLNWYGNGWRLTS